MGSRSSGEGALLREDDVGIFLLTLPSTVPSRSDVRISPHAVDQCSDWLAVEAVECRVKFSQ